MGVKRERKRDRERPQRVRDAEASIVVIIHQTIHNPNTSHWLLLCKELLALLRRPRCIRGCLIALWLILFGGAAHDAQPPHLDGAEPPGRAMHRTL